MVKSATVPGLEAKLLVRGRRTKEYPLDQPSEKSNYTSRYVEATLGANFEVEILVRKEYPHRNVCLEGAIYVDGNWASTALFDVVHLSPKQASQRMAGHLSQSGSSATLRRFRFSDLVTEEGESTSVNKDILQKTQQLGIVKVIFVRSRILHPKADNTIPEPSKAIDKIPEKALKGRFLSSKASYAPPEVASPRAIVQTERIDSDQHPLAVIELLYRTRDDLKTMGVIPRTPSPPPLEERPLEELSPEELRALLRRERESNARVKEETHPSIKRERSLTVAQPFEDTDELSFLTEKPCKRQKPNSDTEVVDLT